jgi:hypothetical protein
MNIITKVDDFLFGIELVLVMAIASHPVMLLDGLGVGHDARDPESQRSRLDCRFDSTPSSVTFELVFDNNERRTETNLEVTQKGDDGGDEDVVGIHLVTAQLTHVCLEQRMSIGVKCHVSKIGSTWVNTNDDFTRLRQVDKGV